MFEPVALYLAAMLPAVAFEAVSDTTLYPRGYELLPNARWIEELERDASTSFPKLTVPLEGRAALRSPAKRGSGFRRLLRELEDVGPQLSSRSPITELEGGLRLEFDPIPDLFDWSRHKKLRKAADILTSFFPVGPIEAARRRDASKIH